jgi:hypothetical protein
MTHPSHLPPEQAICISCGLCCDGTLFQHAHLNAGERDGLPEKMRSAWFSEGEKEYFRLPCGYFGGKCTIYDKHKANVCSSYRCQLLRDFAEGKVLLDEALEVVKDACKTRDELLAEYRRITGFEGKLFFRLVQDELAKAGEKEDLPHEKKNELSLLQAKCNIFEALLIKHIRSADDFKKMI